MEASTKKELLKILDILNVDDFCEFDGKTFYKESEDSYRVFDETGNDLGVFNKKYIRDFMLGKKKNSMIKSKPRKKRHDDLIIPEFMEWLHTQRCVVFGCSNKNIEAHHVTGRQPRRYDNLCVPLCSEHHRGSSYSWHEGNVRKFRKDYPKEKLASIANDLFTRWLDSENVEAIGYDVNKFRFISDAVRNRNCSASSAVKSAILEWESYD